jgi:hypothetical protein
MTPTKKDKIKPEPEIIPAAPVEPVVPEMVPQPLPPELPLSPMPTGSSKPGKVQTIAIMTLVSGITNIIWMIYVGGSLLLGGLASFGITCLFIPLVIPPIVLGIYEIIFASKLMANPAKPVKPSQTIAILQIICILTGNPIPLATGILALVFYSQSEVMDYFTRINNPA